MSCGLRVQNVGIYGLPQRGHRYAALLVMPWAPNRAEIAWRSLTGTPPGVRSVTGCGRLYRQPRRVARKSTAPAVALFRLSERPLGHWMPYKTNVEEELDASNHVIRYVKNDKDVWEQDESGDDNIE